MILPGILIFNFGIARTCARAVPWRAGAISIGGAMFGQAWFTILAPSVTARTVALAAVIVLCKGYAACCAFRAPRGPLRGTLRLIGSLLVAEIFIAVVVFIAAELIGDMSLFHSDLPQIVFTLAIISTGFCSPLRWRF